MAIEDNNLLYTILRRCVRGLYPLAYSKLECRGLDNIPKDGAVIFAPNHTNALMDALTVLYMSNRTTVFVARADIFRNKHVAKLLYFFKLMPIMRMRDGRDNLKKNDEIIQKSVEVLEAGVPFCIFCEGTHRMKHSLLPLVKGIFRIALKCNEELNLFDKPKAMEFTPIGEARKGLSKTNGSMPVYIVPVGIEYGSYTRFRNSLAINVGKAINITRFVDNNSDNPQQELMVKLKTILAPEMMKLFHYVPDDEDYYALLDYSYLSTGKCLAEHTVKSDPYDIMMKNRDAVGAMERMKSEDNTQYQKIMDLMRQFATERRRLKIVDESLYRANKKVCFLGKILLLLCLLPYALWCATVASPILAITELLAYFNEDKAFSNSWRFVFAILLMPLIIIVLNILLAPYLPWYGLVIISIISLPSHIVAHDYAKSVRIMLSDYKLRHSHRLQSLLNRIFH